MKKRVLALIVAFTVIAMVSPRTWQSAVDIAVRSLNSTASIIVMIGEIIHRQAHQADRASPLHQQDAGFNTGILLATYLPGSPVPDRPGCFFTHCEEEQDSFGRRGRRCYWNCPRPSTQSTATVYADAFGDGVAAFILLVILVAIVAGIIGEIDKHGSDLEPQMKKALEDAAEATAAREKLEEAQRNADAVIKRQAKNAFGRGRDGAKP